jgi:hypothetical protein
VNIQVVPAGNNKIIICHWNNGAGHWEAMEINHNGLNGHDNHEYDVWPPVEDVTEGSNWPQGEDMYLNDCALNATASPSPEPSPEPSPTGTLPPTGATENSIALGMALILTGALLKWKSRKSYKKKYNM